MWARCNLCEPLARSPIPFVTRNRGHTIMTLSSNPRVNCECQTDTMPSSRKRCAARLPGFSITCLLAVLAIVGISLSLAGRAQAIDPNPVPPPPNLAPLIVDFVGINGVTEWTIRGRVIDEQPMGLTITFGGLLNGQSTTVQDASGYFHFNAEIQGPGMVTAHTVDNQQKGSNYAIYYIQ